MSQVTVTKEKVMSGPGKSVKTTTYETRTSYDSEPVRRTTLKNRSVLVNRSGGPQYGGGSSIVSRSYSSSMGAGMGAGGYQLVSQTGVTNVKDARVKEKKDMQDLNERFASYIEKVRFLEAQNRKLADELEKLKGRWGKETQSIKLMYEQEMKDLRDLLNDASTKKGELEVKLEDERDRFEDQERIILDLRTSITQLEEKLESQTRELADKEGDLCALRNRCDLMEVEKDRNKKEIQRLQDLVARLREDLDRETLAHVEAEHNLMTLQEEMEFMKDVHEQEMKELAALAYRDTTQENREFWKNEMSNALREISATYDEKLGQMRGELETYYNLKVQEFRTGSARNDMETSHAKEESKRLRTQLSDAKAKLDEARSRIASLEAQLAQARSDADEKVTALESENCELKTEVARLRAEMEAILKELQELMDTKLGLELEIAAYRKLLEGEENRVSMRSVMDSILTQRTQEEQDDSSLKVSQVVKGEMSAKTTYQRSAKGPVSVCECSPDGRSITIENTSRRDEPIGEWQIIRSIDDQKDFTVPLDIGTVARGNHKFKVWCSTVKSEEMKSGDIKAKVDSWGIGRNISTRLVNKAGEDRASHVQRTIYVS